MVPTLNSEKTIQECISSLSQQTYPHETIVADGGSTDSTLSLLPNDVRVISVRGNQAAAMNAGLHAARGSLVAFIDADCIAPPRWLERMVGAMTQTNVAVGSGNTINPRDPLFSRLTWRVMGSLVGCGGTTHARTFNYPRSLRYASSYNSLYIRDMLLELGGFDLALGGAEDVDMGQRILEKGYRIVYSPGGEVWHKGKGSISSFLRQIRGFGWSRGRLCQKDIRNLHFVHLLPFVLYGLTMILIVHFPLATIPIVLVLLGYGVKFSILEHSAKALPLTFIIFALLTMGWCLGLLESAWRKTNPATDARIRNH
jgi:GT2 family glycosyltransferase